MKLLHRLLSATTVATVLVTGSIPALAANYPDFTINENTVPGTAPFGNSALVADRLNGLYTETFAPIFNPGSTTAGTFTTTASFNISAYYNNDVLVPGLLASGICLDPPGCTVKPGYNLYANFQSSGTFATDAFGNITFTGLTAAVQVFLDPDQVLGGDTLLGSTNTLIAGSGSINPALNNGDFEIVFGALNLSAAGDLFFIAPKPFYMVVDVNGNFTENPLLGGQVSGSANAFFQPIPEPASLALVGAALLALGASRRRRA